ncbi:serine/threonine-protein kinase [Micromonospora rubida]|uniref:serine/threonine-protein kinase n=1 Tax=Micromonospora rubida TaxID=2697657 RepID=UPI001377CE74|nr:serine/threonine-protein kinase [Micromonospora rubida]NBE79691.1 protein kinase [Micromonospora rubida]
MLSSGVVLSGRYRLDDRVATGGMGDVWRATDQILGRQVAVKVLLPALVSDPDFIARFRTEARIMAALRHPGIVQVYDCGEDDLPDGGRADYLVMEFVEGQPLSRRIEAAGQLGVAETMSMVTQAAQALHAAHIGGIVHRDVKPSNLLVQDDGTVVLVDFGVARSADVTSITSANAVPGTALYMAPEQAAGRPVSGATDIYALGAVAYCCLTGGPPFTGDNPLQVAVRHLDDEPPELPQEIPASVRELVGRALAKNPAERFATGAAMAEAARATIADDSAPTSTVPVPLRGAAGPAAAPGISATTRDDLTPVRRPAPSSTRRGGRRGTLLGALAAVLVALAGLTAALGLTQNEDLPATKYRPTAPAAVPTPDGGSAATEEAAVDEDRTDRPGPTRSAPASPTATPQPSGSPAPMPSNAPTTSAPANPPTTASTPADPPPTTASTPADPPPTTASTPADPPALNG